MTKRALSLLLAVLILLTAFPFSALAEDELPPEEVPAVEETHSEEDPLSEPDPTPEAEDTSSIQEETSNNAATSGTCGYNMTWSFDEATGTLTIEGSGFMYGSYPWSSFRSKIATVSMTPGIISIGDYAFYDCTSLTSVTIPDSVTSIGDHAFYGCTSLTSITIPDSVTSIGDWAFWGCTGLTSITIPDSVTTIGRWAFSGCTGLADSEGFVIINDILSNYYGTERVLTIPTGVTRIGDGAFRDCSNLTSITFPQGITKIGENAFQNCSGLTKVILPDGVERIGKWAFFACSSLRTIQIPNSVTSIDERAFSGCCSLESITIPDSVTTIGESAFSGCSSLTSITIPDCVVSIGGGAFGRCTGVTSVNLPNGITSIPGSAFGFCTSLTSITIPDSVTSIGGWAFSNCTSLKHATIPSNVTVIGNGAFEQCSGLVSIAIPERVISIGERAFLGCSSLASISISYGVTSIGSYAFESCKGITSIIIPDSVTGIDPYAFCNCTSLSSITLSNNLVCIHNSLFQGCISLSNVTIPNSVTSIGELAFYGCSSLTNIIIPKNVIRIGRRAFENCSRLATIEVVTESETFCSVEGVVFSKDMKTLVVNPNVRTTSFTVPNGVVRIADSAFGGCIKMNSVCLPLSINSIGESAFGNTSLNKVYYSGTMDQRLEISIDKNNSAILNATWYYNSTILTPTPKPLVLPVINTQPQDVTVNNGATAKFSVKAKNGKTYQWEVSTDGGESWAEVAKATKSTLSVKTEKAMAESEHPYQYRCKVSNGDGYVYTEAAVLTVNLVPPVITGQPANISVYNTKKASFTVKAKNGKSFQWEVSEDGESWEAIAGATKASYSLTADYKAMNGKQYRCKVSNGDGYVYTDAATLTVNLVPPMLTGQPVNVSVRSGKNASFSLKAKGAKSYQWEVSTDGGSTWAAVPKATKNKLALQKVTIDMNGNLYRCTAINADGEVTSEPATLTVYLVPPTVTGQPKDAAVKVGKTASFSVKAKEGKTYQWQVNDGSGWVDVPKATKNKLSLKKVTGDMSGNMYRCLVTNADGSVESAAARLTVNP